MMEMVISKEFAFEASHVLPKHPGKCSRLHGHSWKLTVAVRGKVDPETGFVMDYAKLKEIVQPLVDSLDHRHLGTWGDVREPAYHTWGVQNLPRDFYPSSENLLFWIAEQLTPKLPGWCLMELKETCSSACILWAEDFAAVRSYACSSR